MCLCAGGAGILDVRGMLLGVLGVVASRGQPGSRAGRGSKRYDGAVAPQLNPPGLPSTTGAPAPGRRHGWPRGGQASAVRRAQRGVGVCGCGYPARQCWPPRIDRCLPLRLTRLFPSLLTSSPPPRTPEEGPLPAPQPVARPERPVAPQPVARRPRQLAEPRQQPEPVEQQQPAVARLAGPQQPVAQRRQPVEPQQQQQHEQQQQQPEPVAAEQQQQPEPEPAAEQQPGESMAW